MIKKILIFFIILIFSTSSFSLASTQLHNNHSLTVEKIEFSKPIIEYSNEYTKINIDEANSVLIYPDQPLLPIYKKTYIYPAGTIIKDIDFKITSDINKQKILKIEYPKNPVPPGKNSYESTETPINKLININEINYQNIWFNYDISSGINKGEKCIFLNVIFYPIKYYQNNIYYISSCELDIKIEKPKITKLSIDAYDLIIIGPDQFSEQLQTFVNHKENHGLKTKLVTLESIYDSTYFTVEGRDDAEKIKYFIKNAYDNWDITHVLLVGGRKPGIFEKWVTPVRYVNVYWGGDWGKESKYLCDLYFADIYDSNNDFSTWDTDNNNIFSEWPDNQNLKDEIDLYPEVYIGRWPVRNFIELKIIIDKTIEYENSETDNNIVLVGGDNFEEPGIEGEIVCDKSLDYLPGFDYEKVYSTEMPINPETIRNGLGDGALFLHMHGHGNPVKWGTHPPENFDEWEEGLYMTDVPWFTNNQYPITLLGGCHTAMFNVSNFNRIFTYTWRYIPETLGWWLARKINGGGIVTLGYTCYPTASPGEYGDLDGDGNNEPDCVESGYGYIQLQLLKGYGIENFETLGECWGYAINQYNNAFKIPSTIWHLHTIQGFVLMGDPSLKIGGYN